MVTKPCSGLQILLYLPVALFIGLVVRKLALNLNRLFDNRLADTDLMITEHNEGIELKKRNDFSIISFVLVIVRRRLLLGASKHQSRQRADDWKGLVVSTFC